MIPPLSAWGLSGTPAPLPGGHRNTVLRLHDHVLKTTRRSEAAIAWLLPVMDRAQPCGLTTPRPIRSTRGPFVCDGWTCEPFFPGVPAAVAPFADRFEMFHDACRDVPQRPGFASARDLLDADAGGDVDLSGMPERLVTAIRAAWQDVSDHETAIHGDLSANNVLVQSNGTITLIDWDEARRDMPVFDQTCRDKSDPRDMRAAAAWEIACCWRIEPARARKLARAFLAPPP